MIFESTSHEVGKDSGVVTWNLRTSFGARISVKEERGSVSNMADSDEIVLKNFVGTVDFPRDVEVVQYYALPRADRGKIPDFTECGIVRSALSWSHPVSGGMSFREKKTPSRTIPDIHLDTPLNIEREKPEGIFKVAIEYRNVRDVWNEAIDAAHGVLLANEKYFAQFPFIMGELERLKRK